MGDGNANFTKTIHFINTLRIFYAFVCTLEPPVKHDATNDARVYMERKRRQRAVELAAAADTAVAAEDAW